MKSFPIKKILVAVDCSYPIKTFIRGPVELAKSLGAELLFLNVVEFLPMAAIGGVETTIYPTEDISLIKQRLQKQLSPLKVAHRLLIKAGSTPREIRQTADQEKCDLIYGGSHSHGPLSQFFLGSVAEDVARHAQQPVWIQKGKSRKIKTIFVPMDGSPSSLKALAEAGHLARLLKAAIQPASVVVEEFIPAYARHFLKDSEIAKVRKEMVQNRKKEVQEWIQHSLGETSHVKVLPGIIRVGDPKEEIPKMAKRAKADLLMISRHGKIAFGFTTLGRVTARVIHHSPCSVLVTPAETRSDVVLV